MGTNERHKADADDVFELRPRWTIPADTEWLARVLRVPEVRGKAHMSESVPPGREITDEMIEETWMARAKHAEAALSEARELAKELYEAASAYRFEVLPTDYERAWAEELDHALARVRAVLSEGATDG